MALMIPDSIPSKASQGEKTLYSILRERLPDDFMVWYEPIVNKLYPDFIILSPTFGLMIIEVKGWFPSQIVRANNNFFEIKHKRGDTEQVESEQSPLRQGHNYFASILDKLKGYPILNQSDGDYKGKLAFPIGVGAVMSNITEAQARNENIYTLLEKPQVAYRDELLEWMKLGERELIQRFKDMFTVKFSFLALSDDQLGAIEEALHPVKEPPTLTNDQISTIKGVLHPEMAIKEVPATEESVQNTLELPQNSSVIVGLDIDQEKMARDMRDGHRLFSGVAGSGKTLILLCRAKVLANRLIEHRILILCFNITLASHLRSLLHGDDQNPQYKERIEVMHFNAWARSLMGFLPNPQEFNDSEEYDQFLGSRVLAVLQQLPPERKWDSVLVDEAHTFSSDWFLCCVAALKDPQNGDLMIVSDGSQSLYKRRKFTWKSVGIKAKGRSKKLEYNYRNTQQILAAAWKVVQAISNRHEILDDDLTFPVVEPTAALRQGRRPVLHRAETRAQSVEALVQQVQRLSQSGYAPGDIAILYRRKTRDDEALFRGMLRRINDLGLRTYWITESEQTKRNYSVKKPGVRILTALSSLGLEFKVVLILWVDQFANCCSTDSEQSALARRQLYVAMTRAQDELHLFASGNPPILDELEQSQAFDVVQEMGVSFSTADSF